VSLARTRSIALVGVAGHLVEVEADLSQGVPGLSLIGLPDTALSEARDRVRASVVNSGARWPNRRMTINLSPASLPKRGSGFDLALALCVLAADDQLDPAAGCFRRCSPPSRRGLSGWSCLLSTPRRQRSSLVRAYSA